MINFLSLSYHTIIYQPLLNVLVVLYNTLAFGDMGVAIILLTILIRLLLYPVFHKGVRQQTVMQKMQPELKKLQEKHWEDPREQFSAIRSLYREHGANPFSGFLLLLVQIPVIIALFHIAQNILKPDALGALYSFVGVPAEISHTFLGLINLDERSIVVVGIAAILQYFQARLSLAQRPAGAGTMQEKMTRQMAFLMPIVVFFAFLNLPAAVSLYWLTSSAFSLFQQYAVNRELSHGTDRGIYKKTS